MSFIAVFFFPCPSRITCVAVISETRSQAVQFLPGTRGASTVCTRRQTILQGWGFYFVPRGSPNPFPYCMSLWHWVNSPVLLPRLPGQCWEYQQGYRDTVWLMLETTPELVNSIWTGLTTWELKMEPSGFLVTLEHRASGNFMSLLGS